MNNILLFFIVLQVILLFFISLHDWVHIPPFTDIRELEKHHSKVGRLYELAHQWKPYSLSLGANAILANGSCRVVHVRSLPVCRLFWLRSIVRPLRSEMPAFADAKTCVSLLFLIRM